MLGGTDPRATNVGLSMVAKRMFLGGFFLLPWLWLVNWIYLRNYIKRAACPSEVRYYVRGSLLGFLISLALVASWAIYYFVQHNQMGVVADSLAVFIPRG